MSIYTKKMAVLEGNMAEVNLWDFFP